MKIGWYSHHIENMAKTPEIASEGIFEGRFAGGAEMSDWEYKQAAPEGTEIVGVTPWNFDKHDPLDFDSIVVTGLDAFSDAQLLKLLRYEPFVFVHHLQTHRFGSQELINNSRMFVTHTPAHMLKELMWTSPKRTGQVLSHFDTSLCHEEPKEDFALWAARNHPLKGKSQAHLWAAKVGLEFRALSDVPREEVLDTMAKAKHFVHLPLSFESECRAVMEAVLSGCQIKTNPFVGITSVEDWDDKEALKNMIDKAGKTFWNLVLS